MSKTWKFILAAVGVILTAAAVAYAVYAYLNKEGKKPLATFKSKFNEDGTVEAIDVTEAFTEDAPVDTDGEDAPPATPCNDAVCAVDMCMPY
ncbi:MAG: hypothetical protein IKU84_06965 [Clostridia bacterium]|nr:hypothetical protein [Clostridia bacterium]